MTDEKESQDNGDTQPDHLDGNGGLSVGPEGRERVEERGLDGQDNRDGDEESAVRSHGSSLAPARRQKDESDHHDQTEQTTDSGLTKSVLLGAGKQDGDHLSGKGADRDCRGDPSGTGEPVLGG
jgi:hypothetical protein